MVRLRRFGDVVDAIQSAFGRYALNVARISGDIALVGTIFVDLGTVHLWLMHSPSAVPVPRTCVWNTVGR